MAYPNEGAGQVRPRRPRPTERRQSGNQATDRSKPIVTISYPESVDLTVFVDYVSQSLDIKIIYGDELKGQSVIFRPGEVEIPRTQLLDLLRSMLRMHGLAIVEGDVEGWLRIVRTDDIPRLITEIREDDLGDQGARSNRVISQVVAVESNDLAGIAKQIQQFLSSGKASVIQIPDKKLLIITDYEAAVAKALDIIRLIDADPVSVQVVTLPVRHHDPKTVADYVLTMMAEKARLENAVATEVLVLPDLAKENLVVVGSAEDVARVRSLVEQFDVLPKTTHHTVAYSPEYISVTRLQGLVENILAPTWDTKGEMNLLVDEERNRLYVTATQAMHTQIEKLLDEEDVALAEASRPMKIYKPRNRPAQDLIGILSEVLPNVTSDSGADGAAEPAPTAVGVPPGKNRPPAAPGEPPPMPTAQEPIESAPAAAPKVRRIEGDDFILSADEHTNSIIAIGPQEFHQKLVTLLDELDKRQAQILIEMTLVAITFNDSLSLAIELANEENLAPYQSLVFSSFGLSDVDLGTGKRSFRPGGGINAVILGPHETPILVRAIAAHGNSRIIATPRIVVGNNTSSTLSNVEEAPFTSVNASDTVATTSFAGFESAGTTLTVTPHVAEGDHLSLDYTFNFSNFTGSGSVGVPPPRTTNSFSGTIEIPDSNTIIVGGMVSENETDTVTEVPLLGRIPILGTFFQSSDRIRTKSRMYAFIRPTILRDDQFADLKLITLGEMEHAELDNRDYPESDLLWMR